MTHDDVIIFRKTRLKKNPKINIQKKNFENPLVSDEDINIVRYYGCTLGPWVWTVTVRRSKCWKVDQWNSRWWSRKFLNSKVVARNVFVSLRAIEWYQNYKIWPIKILWNIIQSWLHHFMRRIIKFIFWRNSRFEFLFIQDKRAIVRLLLCLLFASIVSIEWPVVGRPAWCHIPGEKKVSTLSPNPPMVSHHTLKSS